VSSAQRLVSSWFYDTCASMVCLLASLQCVYYSISLEGPTQAFVTQSFCFVVESSMVECVDRMFISGLGFPSFVVVLVTCGGGHYQVGSVN